MISVPPQGSAGGGGGAGHHSGLTIDCGGGGGGGGGGGRRMGSPRGKKRTESGSSSSGATTPGSWEEAMSQMSRELHVICRSPDSAGRFTNSPTSPKFLSSYSPPSPKMFVQPPLSPAAVQATQAASVSPPSPVTVLDQAGRPSTPEGLSRAQSLSVRHQQTEENLRQKLSSIVCRGLPRRSLSVNDSTGGGAPRIIKSKQELRKNSGGFISHYQETIDVGQRQIEDLHVVIEDRKLKVFADDSKGEFTPTAADSKGKRPQSDLIKVVIIPDEVVPEKLICIMRDGMLLVRETRTKGGTSGRAPTRTAPSGTLGDRLGALSAADTVRHRSKSDGAQPQPSQGPIVIHDDGSQLLKLVLRIPAGYRMQDLVIKTIDDQLIVSGKKLSTLFDESAETSPEQEEEVNMTSGDEAANEQSASPSASGSPERSPMDNEFVKVFELPNTVDPYSITAHVTERCQLVIQAMLSTRCRCGSF